MTEPRYQAGDIIGETTTDGGRLIKVLHVGEQAYFVRHPGGLGSFDGIPDMEPLETAWAFEGCEAVTYLHERPTAETAEPSVLPRRTQAGQLRCLAGQLAQTNGFDPDDRTRLAAVQLQLEMLADQLDGGTDVSGGP